MAHHSAADEAMVSSIFATSRITPLEATSEAGI
jgi:hypothetical protein